MSSSKNAANLSDFDNSDDDLADLLDDDDDDIYAKKLSISSPIKKLQPTSEKTSPKRVGIKSAREPSSSRRPSISPVISPVKKNSADYSSFLASSPKHVSSRKSSNAFEDDALTEFLNKTSVTTKPKISTPVKKSSDHDESNYLEDLGFSKLSDKSTVKIEDDFDKSNLGGGDDFSSEEDDILKSLESETEDKSTPNSPGKRRGSFFDDFLKQLSPKHSSKKLSHSEEITETNKKEFSKKRSSEDIITDANKSSQNSEGNARKRKETFQKQVSFKDSPEHHPEPLSPKKEKSSTFESSFEKQEPTIKPAPPARRSEKMATSKNDDMDWSSFFKESPKKSVKDEVKKKEFSKDSTNDKINSRRKSSGSDWLGLSEPNSPSKSSFLPDTKNEFVENGTDFLVSDKSLSQQRSVSAPGNVNRTRRSHINPSIDTSWLGEDLSQETEKSNTDYLPAHKNQSGTFQELKKDSVKEEKRSILSVVKTTTPSIPIVEKEIFNVETTFSPKRNTKSIESNYVGIPNNQVAPNKLHNINLGLKTSPVMPSLNQENEFNSMQALLNNYALERDQLIKSSEAMKLMYEERIKSMETLHKDQLKTLEDSFKISENNLKKEMDNIIQKYEDKINAIKKEKEGLDHDKQSKLQTLEKEHLKELQRLKELHNFSVSQMKQDHEDALKRLERLKEQEIEAVLSTQAHSRSLQNLADQLEARTSELAVLQTKVEERNQTTLREKQALLESKEKDLKALQNRLHRQIEDGDEERTRLQQLVLRLESRLQKSTTEGEEDRWEIQQMKAKLNVKQKYLDEEYKLKMEQIEREKEKLQINQNSLLQEQKIVLMQLAQERQQLSQEKVDLELISKKIKEEESKFNMKKLKEESYIERQKQFIQQEENRILSEKNNFKTESQHLEREKDNFERDKQQFMSEKERFNNYTLKIKRRADEIEHMAMIATEEKERAKLEHSSALKMKSEYQSKMQQIAQQMQLLMEKEHQILQDKEMLAEEKYELENKKNSMVCMKCKLSTQIPLNVTTANISNPPVMTYPIVNALPSHTPQTFIDPNLLLWQISAQKDRAYLEEQLSYLRSLKEINAKQEKK